MTKIFGIGLSRTGTTSLCHALKDGGINIVHYPKSKADLFNPKTEGACDIPVVVYYKELDKKFPNSKFIYTIRDKDEWLESVEKYLKQKKDRRIDAWQKQMRIDIYGQVEFNKELFATKYDEHDADIKTYFKNRKDDLLILNICGGADLNKLISFVDGNKKILSNKFPHINKRKIK